MKIAVVLGTRPEIVKMAPVIKELTLRQADSFVLHTGQHYSYMLDKVFFEELKLPSPKYNLNVGSGSHGEATGRMLIGIEPVLKDEKPDFVLVQGDTNSVLAGALAAVKLGIKIGHVEAGLRSYDRSMPEEINRIVADHMSDYLFTPTPKARETLLHEGISEEKTFVTGNTVVDAVFQNLEIARSNKDVLKRLHLKPNEYFLVTVHRQENVDNFTRLASIIEGLDKLASEFARPVVYPLHPRAKKMMETYNLRPANVILTEPLDYFDFLRMIENAGLVLTDSGGVQEESCVLHVPCVTLRDNTERPETVEVGANTLGGASPNRMLVSARAMLNAKRDWKNPFGDGNAAKRIVDILEGKNTGHPTGGDPGGNARKISPSEEQPGVSK
jgi:UDP-N-acetylglucosamine 2-epimerase (non-hydrolysing)